LKKKLQKVQRRRRRNEATPSAKKTIESIVKETFFAEIEKLTQENIELKAKLENLSKVDEVAVEATELADIKPIAFNPENTNEVETFVYGSKRPRTIMDSILEKINK
jgi:formylglycine-generating enzyme required for sulfatase activity